MVPDATAKGKAIVGRVMISGINATAIAGGMCTFRTYSTRKAQAMLAAATNGFDPPILQKRNPPLADKKHASGISRGRPDQEHVRGWLNISKPRTASGGKSRKRRPVNFTHQTARTRKVASAR
jgi:hypothetical protein